MKFQVNATFGNFNKRVEAEDLVKELKLHFPNYIQVEIVDSNMRGYGSVYQ